MGKKIGVFWLINMKTICVILVRTLNPNYLNELELDYISEILVVLKAAIKLTIIGKRHKYVISSDTSI